MSKDVRLTPDPTSLPEDVTLLKQMILELQQAQQRSQRTITGLQQQLEQLLRRLYGPRGEKFDPVLDRSICNQRMGRPPVCGLENSHHRLAERQPTTCNTSLGSSKKL